MRRNKILLAAVVFLLLPGKVSCQEKSYFFYVEAIGGYATPGYVPFWMKSNQYGSIPLDGTSLSLIGSAHKDFDRTRNSLFDWGASFEGRANIGHKSNFTLIEGYGKLRLSVFEIRAGRSKEIMGLCDSTLSCGAFAVSGNALGIPKVQVSIPEFYTLPFFGKLIAFKGSYAHGWLGNTSMVLNGNVTKIETYFHQKSFYGRFGKPEWKLKLYGGFNHQTFWGNEKDYYGDIFTLSPLKTYLYVITGTPYGNADIPSSKIGNHLGSIDLGFEYQFKNFRLLAYRQFVYDVGALYYLANLRDGLNGLSLVNSDKTGNKFHWRKILVEIFYTKNQAGELWSPFTASGDEDYYNNYQYLDGWSYRSVGIGNPFICSPEFTREGLPADPVDHFINNRVIAFHFGFEGSVQKWNFILKTSYSLNYGTFGTSVVGHTFGKERTLPLYGIFSETQQFSAYFGANREFDKGLNFGFVGAFDTGELYYNSFGLQLKLAKSF